MTLCPRGKGMDEGLPTVRTPAKTAYVTQSHNAALPPLCDVRSLQQTMREAIRDLTLGKKFLSYNEKC